MERRSKFTLAVATVAVLGAYLIGFPLAKLRVRKTAWYLKAQADLKSKGTASIGGFTFGPAGASFGSSGGFPEMAVSPAGAAARAAVGAQAAGKDDATIARHASPAATSPIAIAAFTVSPMMVPASSAKAPMRTMTADQG